MNVITIPEAIDLAVEVGIGMKMPIMYWGQPGIGKSEMMAEVARRVDGVLVDIRLSQWDSVDMRGIPVADEFSESTKWLRPSVLPFVGNADFPTDKPIILLWDEANSATAAVSAVMYQLTNDRRCGEHALMPNVYQFLAGNREGDRGVTNKQPLPLSNRLIHAEVSVDVDAWCVWAQANGITPLAIAFFQWQKTLLNQFEEAKEKGFKAFATPRSVTKAMLIYVEPGISQKSRLIGMNGAMGEGVTASFMGFVDIYNKVTPIKKIIADPLGVEVPQEQSFCYATAVSVSGHMAKDKNLKALYQFLQRMDPEYVVLAWKLAMQRDADIYTAPEFLDFSKKYRTIFQP